MSRLSTGFVAWRRGSLGEFSIPREKDKKRRPNPTVAFIKNSCSELFGLTLAAFGIERGLLGADNRVVFGFLVLFDPDFVLGWIRHVREDRFNRTFRQTGIAIDADIGIDQKQIRPFVEGLNRANRGAIGVFAFNTRFGNDVCHLVKNSPESVK